MKLNTIFFNSTVLTLPYSALTSDSKNGGKRSALFGTVRVKFRPLSAANLKTETAIVKPSQRSSYKCFWKICSNPLRKKMHNKSKTKSMNKYSMKKGEMKEIILRKTWIILNLCQLTTKDELANQMNHLKTLENI